MRCIRVVEVKIDSVAENVSHSVKPNRLISNYAAVFAVLLSAHRSSLNEKTAGRQANPSNASPLLEIALVLVRSDHVPRFIINANHHLNDASF